MTLAGATPDRALAPLYSGVLSCAEAIVASKRDPGIV